MKSKNLKTINYDKWTKVLRPFILKRDRYSCQVCGVKHKELVYINSLNNYVICDDFIYQWAVLNNKKPFKIVLKIGTMDGADYSEDPNNLISLCPVHYNYLRNNIFKTMRHKLNNTKFSSDNKLQFHLHLWNINVINPFSKEIKKLTGIKLSGLEASQLINNLINTIQNVKN